MFRRNQPKIEPKTGPNEIVRAREDLRKAQLLHTDALSGARKAHWTAAELKKVRERNNISPAIRRSILGEA